MSGGGSEAAGGAVSREPRRARRTSRAIPTAPLGLWEGPGGPACARAQAKVKRNR